MSVAFYCWGSDSGETVEQKLDSFVGEAGTIDVTGSGLESIPCLGKSFTKSGQDFMVDLTECVSDVQNPFDRKHHRCHCSCRDFVLGVSRLH